MKDVLIPLAQGCEELEAVTVIDLLRRARLEVVVAGLDGSGEVRASRGTRLLPDVALEAVANDDFRLVVLPGGLPGADHLAGDERVLELLRRTHGAGQWVAAICAAPKVLARAGLLDGRRATSYPGALEGLSIPGLDYREEPVVVDGRVVTSRGPGTAMDFALALIECLEGAPRRAEVEGPLLRPTG